MRANEQRQEWERITNEIRPHYLAEVPFALAAAFPNEDTKVYEYRRETYQAKTEAPLVDAIGELTRLLSESKHSISFENDAMRELIAKKRIEDRGVVPTFFEYFISERVIDPNGVFIVEPVGPGLLDSSTRVDFRFKAICSGQIRLFDPRAGVLVYCESEQGGIKNLLPIGNYKVVTDTFFGEIVSGEAEKLKITYRHNLGRMPFVVFGGRAVNKKDYRGNIFKVFRSDFSPAVPYLNAAAISDNQANSVMLACCFPV
jgi:hypothetical protein